MMENIEVICEQLVTSFNQEHDDPLAIVIDIDMYAEEVNEYGSILDKEVYLKELLKQLQEHHDIVGKIGWDLPEVLLKFYVPKNIDVRKSLHSSDIIITVMKCFNEIALAGNPKECLLTGCELLSKLSILEFKKIEDKAKGTNNDDKGGSNDTTSRENLVTVTEDGEYLFHRTQTDFFFGLYLHVIFELIVTTLRRISTLYPSKYLGMATAAIMKCVRNNIDYMDDCNLILRRIYTFCRGYLPAEIPRDLLESEKISNDDLKRISEKELDTQGKLLQVFSTFGIDICLRNFNTKIDVKFFYDLARKAMVISQYENNVYELISRYYQLAQAFDINLEDELLKFIKDSRKIYSSLPKDSEITSDEARVLISQAVYKLSYTYSLQKITKQTKFTLDQQGIFILSGFHYFETCKHLLPELDIKDAIYMYLRVTTPTLYADVYRNNSSENIARYWLWVSIINSSIEKARSNLKELPSYVFSVFFEVLLTRNLAEHNEETRLSSFTLLTRLLCLAPEDVAFDVIMQVLEEKRNLPAKSCVLGIMKDLTTRTRQCFDDFEKEECSIANKMKEMNIEDKSTTSLMRPYLVLDDHKMNAIHKISLNYIVNFNLSEYNESALLLMLNFIKFFNAVNEQWDNKLLIEVQEKIDAKFNEKRNYNDKGEVKLILEANKKLGDYLK
ncbi:hypothetical protein Kpol_534p49 [Vanderwaltozyma polyspora DSM 70294]|uniref:YAP1-binding protein 1 n=1 Tax=Vanderwaltozyma polyspora (strain ATCC 22028 / DSM 70294 / BCRC 21397 / CBS 2163 / NBRC 10782 / NRRL Y-8283 / UCD 57-17) TaxID=436907 RepID=A7TJM5_VANPO|nr:uncharacterized protein Kpol_534p49 [Vanderwaltozyma polyspora DSM 70294]EDO17568.1 hypothetical protein Kpol_534p49 [Vanderwaltozyma polyspora DSM 70294]